MLENAQEFGFDVLELERVTEYHVRDSLGLVKNELIPPLFSL